MRKKNFMLLCIAAVAIATFVVKKNVESHADGTHDLLLQNVEALTESPETKTRKYHIVPCARRAWNECVETTELFYPECFSSTRC